MAVISGSSRGILVVQNPHQDSVLLVDGTSHLLLSDGVSALRLVNPVIGFLVGFLALMFSSVGLAADSTVSGLPAATAPLTGSELLYCVQSGADRKCTALSASSAGSIDPLAAYNASGVRTTTTGTISSGTSSLSVLSASGWSVGMGIAVANAGSGGNTELITTITAINGTTFTLSANAAATATGQVVNHDDTAAIQAAINAASTSLQRLRLRAGNYNVTSEITINAPVLFECDGAVDNLVHSAPKQNRTGGTVIWNRGTTNNVLKITSAYVHLRGCSILQDASITPTAGYGLILTSATERMWNIRIENNIVFGTYGAIKIGGGVSVSYILNNLFEGIGGTSNSACSVYVDNPPPDGNIQWIGNDFFSVTPGPGVCIFQSDTNQWTHNAFNNGWPTLYIKGVTGQVVAQSFVNNTFENSGGVGRPLALVDGSSGIIDGISFVGGEFGVDSGLGGITVSGANARKVTIIGAVFYNMSGTPISVTGGTVTIWGNISAAGTAAITNMIDGVAAVTCAAGTPSSSFAVTNGVVTHC